MHSSSSSPSIFCAKCLCKLDHLNNPPISETSQTISSHVRNGFNLPLSPVEITEIDTFLVNGSEGLSEYDTAIAEVEGLLISLKNSRDRLQRRCDSAQYLISAPIRRLPLDVLHEIFTLFCEMDVPDEAHYGASGVYTLYIAKEVYCPTLKLTWVCSFWRTFIQSCPNLWSSISLPAATFESGPASFQILVKYLSHSSGSLLDFDFDFDFAASGDNLIVQEAIELLWDCSTRWRQAVLSGDNFLKAGASLVTKSSEPTQIQLGSFPALEDLKIRTLDWSSQESFLQCLLSCPRLQVVKLLQLSWSGHNADFSCVTSLTINLFVGRSFGHLLCRLPVLESLEVCEFELSEDDDDGGWAGSYRSSLRRLTVLSYTFQPMAWRFVHLPHLVDLTLTTGTKPLQHIPCFSSVLDDSQCQLENLQIYSNHCNDLQSQEAVNDFIASQHSLTHLVIYLAIDTNDVYPFSRFLKGDVIRNLRSLEFNATYDSQNLASIYDVIESRCTVLSSPDGNPEISGLQALTLNSDIDYKVYFTLSVHNRLSLLREAGFKLAGNIME